MFLTSTYCTIMSRHYVFYHPMPCVFFALISIARIKWHEPDKYWILWWGTNKYHLENLKNLEEKENGLFHNYLPNHVCQIKVHKVLIMDRTALQLHQQWNIALSIRYYIPHWCHTSLKLLLSLTTMLILQSTWANLDLCLRMLNRW